MDAFIDFGKDVVDTLVGELTILKAIVYPIFWIILVIFLFFGSLARYANSKADVIPKAIRFIIGGLGFIAVKASELVAPKG